MARVRAVTLFTGLIIATANAFAPRVRELGIYIATLAIPMFCAVFYQDFQTMNFLMSFLILFVSIYAFWFGTKVNRDLVVIYEQGIRIQKDLKSATEIQRSLLPQMPLRAGDCEIDILYKPSEQLSGDFYDAHVIGEKILFYVADVTDHGTAAAQVTYLIKGIFKNIVDDLHLCTDVKLTAKKLSADFASYKLDYAVGILIGLIDLKTRRLEYYVSNFSEPILLREGKIIHLKAPTNSYLSALTYNPESEIKTEVFELAKEDSLFVFSDGVYEFNEKSSGRSLGVRRFSKMLNELPQEDWASQLLTKLANANGSESFEDDLSVLRVSLS